MKKYWYFTAIVTTKLIAPILSGLSQDYYVSAVVENENAEGLFTFGAARIEIFKLLEKNKKIQNLLDVNSVHFTFINQVSKHDFEHEKGCVTRK